MTAAPSAQWADFELETMKVHLGHMVFERKWRQENRVNYGVSQSDIQLEEDILILENAIRYFVVKA